MRPAFVVTVHQSSIRPNGHSLLNQYLASLQKHLHPPYDVFVMENASQTKYNFDTNHHYRYFPDQQGGMTRCWNEGTMMAVNNGNDFICVTNEDLIFNSTINNFFDDVAKYPDINNTVFGVLCDNPSTWPAQFSITTGQGYRDVTGNHKPIHGWFTGFSANYYNKYNINGNVFDPSFPWRGQESFQQRDWLRGARSVVVQSCLISHEHLGSWRQVESNV